MESYLSDRDHGAYIAPPPILILASSSKAAAKAAEALAAADRRIAGCVEVAQACDRIEAQVAASALWVELDCELTVESEKVLNLLKGGVAAGRFAGVVSGTGNLLDALAAKIDDPAIELIIDADEAERAAAMALALQRLRTPLRVSDVAADKNAARLRQLSDEVSRIASTLARLSAGPGESSARMPLVPDGEIPAVAAETVRSIIRARRLRSRYFPEDLFADPAWDMLLDLLQAEISQLRVPVSSLCIAAAVPATTALRWLKAMVEEGLFIRRADPHDGRRVFVELAPDTSKALHRYFAEVGNVAVI